MFDHLPQMLVDALGAVAGGAVAAWASHAVRMRRIAREELAPVERRVTRIEGRLGIHSPPGPEEAASHG